MWRPLIITGIFYCCIYLILSKNFISHNPPNHTPLGDCVAPVSLWCWCHSGAGAGVTPVSLRCWCHSGAGAGVTPVLVLLRCHSSAGATLVSLQCWCHSKAGVLPVLPAPGVKKLFKSAINYVQSKIIAQSQLYYQQNMFNCYVCGEFFTRQFSLKRHMKRKHAQPNVESVKEN